MNRRTLVAFALAIASVIAAAQAQEKSTPSKSKSEDKQPKVLTFQSDINTPAVTATGAFTPVPSVKPNPLLDGPAQMVDAFFATLREGRIDEGYAVLTKGSKIAEKPPELAQLKDKTKEAIEVFGKIVGYDFVEAHNVGTRLVRATYISQGTVFPLRWRFYFYKPIDTWRLIDMRVDDKLTGLFDEPADAKPPESKDDASDSPLK